MGQRKAFQSHQGQHGPRSKLQVLGRLRPDTDQRQHQSSRSCISRASPVHDLAFKSWASRHMASLTLGSLGQGVEGEDEAARPNPQGRPRPESQGTRSRLRPRGQSRKETQAAARRQTASLSPSNFHQFGIASSLESCAQRRFVSPRGLGPKVPLGTVQRRSITPIAGFHL